MSVQSQIYHDTVRRIENLISAHQPGWRESVAILLNLYRPEDYAKDRFKERLVEILTGLLEAINADVGPYEGGYTVPKVYYPYQNKTPHALAGVIATHMATCLAALKQAESDFPLHCHDQRAQQMALGICAKFVEKITDDLVAIKAHINVLAFKEEQQALHIHQSTRPSP